VDPHQETDNLAKYERAGIVESRLLARFRAGLTRELQRLAPGSVLDAGCGEGVVTAWIAQALPGARVAGVEARAEAVDLARRRNPELALQKGDLYGLPFDDGSFEVVVATEVLEHLDRPQDALRELVRVASGHVVLTVPHEPFFRGGNLARGRYLARLGSTPGHQGTWGRRGLRRLVAAEAEPVRWVSLFPWQCLVARVGAPGERR